MFQSLLGSLVEDGTLPQAVTEGDGAEPKVTLDLALDAGLTADEYDRILARPRA